MRNVSSDFAQALLRHRSGELQQAAAIYRAVLEREPHHADALHLLGVIASENGEHRIATALIVRAIQIRGPEPVYCANLGVALSRDKQFESAAVCYQQALRGNPSDAQTWARLGRAWLGVGNVEGATGALERSLQLAPGHADVHYELAVIFRTRGMAERAVENFRRATELIPAFVEAHFELANELYSVRRYEEAAAAYTRAVELQPAHAEAWYNLGVVRTAEERLSDAAAAYREALRIRPDYPEAHNNLGVVLRACGQTDAAVEHYRAALGSAPQSVDARYNLALLLQERDQLEPAAEAYRELLEHKPDHAESVNNLGNVYLALGSPEEALQAYRRAIGIDPVFGEARWNVAIVQLLLGQYEEGWRGYEWRFRQKHYVPRCFSRPRWDGEALQNRGILVHAEQGLGDTLQFIRYAPLLKERGAFVIVECHAPLAGVIAGAPGVDAVVALGSSSGGGPPEPGRDCSEYDCQVPLLSLPYLLGTTLDTIPRDVPYLPPPDAARVGRWGAIVNRRAGRDLKVGLTWSGNPDHKMNRLRSLDGAALAALADLPGVSFFALQKGLAALALAPALPMIHLEDDTTNLADTAAILANLDLLITVDTSIAHLAGALGRPVWTLLPFAPDWRWLLEREDCPWYPTMRLFRQPRRHGWPDVMARVREELRRLTL
ncbi:MAG: tetratricopeptide repeat protein [Bryobacteraceae bacterium]